MHEIYADLFVLHFQQLGLISLSLSLLLLGEWQQHSFWREFRIKTRCWPGSDVHFYGQI